MGDEVWIGPGAVISNELTIGARVPHSPRQYRDARGARVWASQRNPRLGATDNVQARRNDSIQATMNSTVADLLSAGRQGTFCLGSTDESPQSSRPGDPCWLIGGMVKPSSRHARPVVAILLPHGPLLAATLVGVMCHGAAAPLNPRLSASEITYVLNDLQADMLLTVPGFHPDGEAAARELDIAVVDRTDNSHSKRVESTPAGDDVALMLHTSGTTARPNSCH